MTAILREGPLSWRAIAAVAAGADLTLSPDSWARIGQARAIVEVIVARGIRAYGVNTGVGALSDTVVDRERQRDLSRNLIMSHAVGVGPLLDPEAVRAIIAAQINNLAHGKSGVRPVLVEGLMALLSSGCVPEVPSQGSVGYLTHMAHIGLVLIGAGRARVGDETLVGAEILTRLGMAPLVLEAKEGLSLINGAPCATGLACVALARAERLLDWADAAAAMTFERLGGQAMAYDAESLALHRSPGLAATGAALRSRLAGSGVIAAAAGKRTQDPLSLRAVPHVHGAARDALAQAGEVVDRELASVTDNPAIAGTIEAPRVFSEAHAVAAALALAMDALGVAVASVAAMAERRVDRLVNPLVSGLQAFLAAEGGVCSGFMIAQYTALALVTDNRRLAAPASLDGGITSALQEDHLPHATPAATKALAILANAEKILAIELLAAAQAGDLAGDAAARAAGTQAVHEAVRRVVGPYQDNRPLGYDIESLARSLGSALPPP